MAITKADVWSARLNGAQQTAKQGAMTKADEWSARLMAKQSVSLPVTQTTPSVPQTEELLDQYKANRETIRQQEEELARLQGTVGTWDPLAVSPTGDREATQQKIAEYQQSLISLRQQQKDLEKQIGPEYAPNLWQRTASAGKSIGNTIAAAPLVLRDTAGQLSVNAYEERQNQTRQGYIQELNAAIERRNQILNSPSAYTDSPLENAEFVQLENRIRELEALIAETDVITPVSMDTKGMQLMQKAGQQREHALVNLEGADRWLSENLIGVGQSAATLPLGLINPSAPLAVMGTVAAGSKAAELNMRGTDPAQALTRGLVAGGIEALTEKLPVDNVLDLIKHGGKNVVVSILKQAGIEATEEGVSYVLNFLADKAAKDPNATFSLSELGGAMASGGFSGFLMGGGAALTNKAFQALPVAPRKAQNIFALPVGAQVTQAQETAPAASQGKNKTASTGETESTAINDNPMTHTPEEQAVIEAYKKSGSGKLRAFIERVRLLADNDESNKIRENIDVQTTRAAEKAKALTGVDTSGFRTIIKGNAVRHIDKRHGAKGKADRSMANIDDFSRIGFVLDNFTDARIVTKEDVDEETAKLSREWKNSDNTASVMVQYSMPVNGIYYVVEAIPASQAKVMAVISAYMSSGKKQGTALDQELNMQRNNSAPSPQLTSETQLDMLGSPTRILTPTPASVNTKSSHVEPTDSVGAAPAGFTGDTVRGFSTNLATDTARHADIQHEAQVNPQMYFQLGNAETLQKAMDIMAQGLEKAKATLHNALGAASAGKKLAPEMVPLSKMVADQLAANGDIDSAWDILSSVAVELTEAGRLGQAARILRDASPAARAMTIQKTVDKLNKRFSKSKTASAQKGRNGGFPVSTWMDKVGATLADEMVARLNTKPAAAKTIADTVLSDLRSHMRSITPDEKGKPKTRKSDMSRIRNMYENEQAYQEAWESAKNTFSAKFGHDQQALAVFDWWMSNSIDYADALTKELTGQDKIKVDRDLLQKYMAAETDEARDAALDEIYQNIADQIPSTFIDRLNALRYLNMLGNLRTQGRNIIGNALNMGVRTVDQKFQALMQALVYGNDPSKRTTTLTRDPALYDLAKQDFEVHKAEAMGEGKYSDYSTRGIQKAINDKRTIFKSKPLEKARVITSSMMEAGDRIFSKPAYADALARYLQAKGYTAEQWQNGEISSDVMEAAVKHAVKEAQEATFRESNAFSNLIAGIHIKNADNVPKKLANAAIQGVLPFTRTPANVLVQAERHSPLGLFNAAANAVMVKKGVEGVTGNDVIKSLSQSLSGTALMALGYILARLGVVTGGENEDEKLANLDKLQGMQEYSIVLPNGDSVTYEWATPAALPFAMGAELASIVDGSGFSGDDAMRVISSITDVMLNMSMLQGLNSVFEGVQYSKRPLVDVFVGGLVDYLTQGITPTLFGQIERTFEDKRMTTFTDKDSAIPTDWQYRLGSASQKLPGWDFQQVPYIDAWGRTQDSGNIGTRAVENFLSPGYISSDTSTGTEDELRRLAKLGYGSSVVPKVTDKDQTVTYTVGDVSKTRRLSESEYVRYATTKGQTSLDLVSDMIDSDVYGTLTDAQKAEAIKIAYEYATHVASEDVTGGKYESPKFVELAQEAKKNLGLTEAEYLLLRGVYRESIDGIEGDKNWKGKPVPDSRKKKILSAIDALDISDSEKDALYLMAGYAEKELWKAPWN